MSHGTHTKPRHLVVVLGDQLDHRSAAFDGFDSDRDAVWMAENHREATHVWCHKQRLAIFFSAMRHYREEAREAGRTVHYHALTRRKSDDRGQDFAQILSRDVRRLRPQKLIVVEPGDYRVWKTLAKAAEALDVVLDVRPDRHFYCGIDEFRAWSETKKGLLQETFYRHMRETHDILMHDRYDAHGDPVGCAWNFDRDNREAFDRNGPAKMLGHKNPRRFALDDTDREVMQLVAQRFGGHPGALDDLAAPRTHDQASALLRDFIRHRLPLFGTYQDAMWTGEDFLWHSRLSVALNLKLLDPRACVQAAEKAYRDRDAPLNSVEGFIRQILGWREFIRGVYWLRMPDYIERNALECDDNADIPRFFWDGDTDMNCVHHAMRSVIDHGYAHHILRLMVLGLFSLLLGVHPRRFHDWHMAMYLDAIDWVSLPNALGMSQYGDGGTVGTKPYAASGNYIHKMSNFCDGCRYRPKKATGDDACPFTTLYWDFLARHRRRFRHNPRMGLQLKNLDRKNRPELREIRRRARELQNRLHEGERI